MPSLSGVPAARDNNFNLIRQLAAIGVLVSHSFPLALGRGSPEPQAPLTGASLGELAVCMFFAISGFFITGSFERRKDFAGFVAARLARVFPGLIVMLVLTVAVLGPAFTALPIDRYLTSPRTLTYVPRNLTLQLLQWDLPGVFTANPYPNVVNGSLWTLIYEVAGYALVAVVGLAGGLRRDRFAGLLAVYLATVLVARAFGHHSAMIGLSLPFVIGMAFYVFRDVIPLRFGITLGLAGLSWASIGTVVAEFSRSLFVGYTALWLGHLRVPGLRGYNRLGDYSYGTYIYAFPVQQAVTALLPGSSPWLLTALALPVTALLSVLSWHLVESPALERRDQLARFLRFASVRPAVPH